MKRTKDNIFELINMLEAIKYEDVLEPGPISPEPDDKFVTPPESQNPSLTTSVLICDTVNHETTTIESSHDIEILLPNEISDETCNESKSCPDIIPENALIVEEESEKEELRAPLSTLRCSHSACDGDKCKFDFTISQNPAKPKKILGFKNKSPKKKKKSVESKKSFDGTNEQIEENLKSSSNCVNEKDECSSIKEFTNSVFWSVPVVSIVDLDLPKETDSTDNHIPCISNLEIKDSQKDDKIDITTANSLDNSNSIEPDDITTSNDNSNVHISNESKTDDDQSEAVSNDSSVLQNTHQEKQATKNDESTNCIVTVLDEKDIDKNETLLKDDSIPQIHEPLVSDTERNEATILIAPVINEIVDAASTAIEASRNCVDTDEIIENELSPNYDNKTQPLEIESVPIRQRMPSAASSDGRLSRKISYDNGSTIDPINVALNDLRLSVSEFCDICLQELQGL